MEKILESLKKLLVAIFGFSESIDKVVVIKKRTCKRKSSKKKR